MFKKLWRLGNYCQEKMVTTISYLLIEKGVGCLSLWGYEGKIVLVTSSGIFLGVVLSY